MAKAPRKFGVFAMVVILSGSSGECQMVAMPTAIPGHRSTMSLTGQVLNRADSLGIVGASVSLSKFDLWGGGATSDDAGQFSVSGTVRSEDDCGWTISVFAEGFQWLQQGVGCASPQGNNTTVYLERAPTT